MASVVNQNQSTPRKVKALLSSFIHGSPSEDTQCSEEKDKVLHGDDVDFSRNSDGSSAGDLKRVFQPDNKVAFYQRVQTYTPFKWFDALTTLTPLECSKYGWENIDTNTLKCVSCKEVLYAGSPEITSFEQDCDISKNMMELIKTAHSSICPWPTSPSPGKFCSVVEPTPSSTASKFSKRMKSIITEKDNLPKLDLDDSISESTGLSDLTNTIQKCSSQLQTCEKIEDEQLCVAGFLALFGWSNVKPEGVSILICNHCKRQAGLWNFTSLKENQNGVTSSEGTSDVEPDPKRRKMMPLPVKAFNPSTEHRNWCPWVLGITLKNKETDIKEVQASGDQVIKQMLEPVDPTAAGWKQTWKMLDRHFEESSNITRPTLANTIPPSQAWKTVKKILGFFQGKPTT
ncbi:zinc finger C3HC-type protein 1-like [Antedon mediterranea]|uniref:zinc finger C3HC-type protein 1-like n=1 Tax=Antedon mediterranea TaxID=105859 RepID=UPI003AF6EFE2